MAEKSKESKKNQSGRGGYRPNAGRKKGTPNRVEPPLKRAREATEAAATGLLPHQWLLEVVRTGQIDGEVLTRKERIEAAKAAAPYYAAKLASVEITPTDGDGKYAPIVQVYIPGNGR